MTVILLAVSATTAVSTHMPLARHDDRPTNALIVVYVVSTHMPLARHDERKVPGRPCADVSTHMPLARHDPCGCARLTC